MICSVFTLRRTREAGDKVALKLRREGRGGEGMICSVFTLRRTGEGGGGGGGGGARLP